jgi:nitrate reductase gamma subunit/ferredoxin
VGNDSFPRRMIRYGQIGARDRLLASKEVWQCFYCGECSDTCPRQAEPGEFMAAARRYAIASADPTRISHLLYTSKLFTALSLLFLSVVFTLLVLIGHGPMATNAPVLFRFHETEGFMWYKVTDTIGLVLISFAGLMMIVGVLRMIFHLSSAIERPSGNGNEGPGWFSFSRVGNAARAVISELAAHTSFRDCEEEPKLPWYRGKRFVHWSIMWGFVGLLIATITDWVLDAAFGKAPGQPSPLWFPPRLLGTVAGIFLVYGTGAAIIQRWTRPDKYFSHSLLSDWLLVWLLFLAGVTGFVVEIGLYMPSGASWMYIALVVHAVLGMEVVILLPFTKFAHAIYRPVALFIHNLIRIK